MEAKDLQWAQATTLGIKAFWWLGEGQGAGGAKYGPHTGSACPLHPEGGPLGLPPPPPVEVGLAGGGEGCPPPLRYGIQMRVHDRYCSARSRGAKHNAKKKALQ